MTRVALAVIAVSASLVTTYGDEPKNQAERIERAGRIVQHFCDNLNSDSLTNPCELRLGRVRVTADPRTPEGVFYAETRISSPFRGKVSATVHSRGKEGMMIHSITFMTTGSRSPSQDVALANLESIGEVLDPAIELLSPNESESVMKSFRDELIYLSDHGDFREPITFSGCSLITQQSDRGGRFLGIQIKGLRIGEDGERIPSDENGLGISDGR